ncbi:MAG: carboxy terminal-processing peptidase [Planctomycetales bacterium]|nr:carboxy terminal-processing peptidase [Planctomycetales bacterium]
MRTYIELTWRAAVVGVVCLAFTTISTAAQRRSNPPVEEMEGPRPLDRTIIKQVVRFLEREHLSKHALNDEISERAFDQFLKSLDPLKLYFYQSDIDSLKSDRLRLDDFAKQGQMEFAIGVFKLFLRRVDERVEMAHKQIDAPHDFNVEEELLVERDKLSYPGTTEEAMDRMRRQIKYRLLLLESDKLRAEKNADADKEQSEAEKVLAVDHNEDPRERLHRSYRTIQKGWHQTDADELLELYVTAITTGFDPHTSYMSADTLENFTIVMSLNLDGIGAQLTSEDGYTKLTSIVPGGAAAKDGRLQPGDRIVQVGQGEDGTMNDVVDMKLDDVVRQIRGTAGTIVRLSVLPVGGGDMQTYNITRAKITLDDSAARSEVVEYGKKADGTPYRFGYIDLPSFYMDMAAARENQGSYRSTTRDVSRILADFQEERVDVVLLDLSRNGGGSLTEAINLTGLFIDTGPVVQVKDRNGQVDIYEDTRGGTAWDGPLVVMTSKESASASEILAGAIQDYHRGIIVGDPATHGKGTVQSLVDLGDRLLDAPGEMGALKITIQQFYLPGGRSTQKAGVKSDIILPAITASIDNAEADLDYALPNDQVRSARFKDYKMVDGNLLAGLRDKSRSRVDGSSGFAKLLKRIEMYKAQKDEEYVALDREDFLRRRAELDAQREEEEQAIESQLPKKEVFQLDYYHREVLDIARDYVEVISKLDLAQAS